MLLRSELQIANVAGRLHLDKASAKEHLNAPFEITVEVSCLASIALEEEALHQNAWISIEVGGRRRVYHGIIGEVELVGPREAVGEQHILYRMTLVPRAWLMSHRKTSRIFQNLSVDQVIRAVLALYFIPVRFALSHPQPVRKYCTQYEETDLEFVQRLAAEEGLIFFFQHPADTPSFGNDEASTALQAAGSALSALGGDALSSAVGVLPGLVGGPREAMVFTDGVHGYPSLDDEPDWGDIVEDLQSAITSMATGALSSLGQPEISAAVGQVAAFARAAGPLDSAPALHFGEFSQFHHHDDTALVTAFRRHNRLKPIHFVFRDYDPERPQAKLESRTDGDMPEMASALMSAGRSALTSVISEHAGELGGLLEGAQSALEELIDPDKELEQYEHQGRYHFPDWTHGMGEAARMKRASHRMKDVGEGTSRCPWMTVGHRFRLEDHPVERLNEDYVVVSVTHEWSVQRQGAGTCENRFECVRASVACVPERPQRRTIHACLTAKVQADDSTHIHTQEGAMIMVRFHWDRGQKGQRFNTCWLRMMQPWAGPGFGTLFIPRKDSEVVVTFEGGDPDRPIVIGCLYNGANLPPHALPQHRTKTGIRTRSTPGGEGSNELWFEDASGREQIYLHAERDLDEVVGNNHSLLVRQEETIRVLGDRLDAIEQSLRQTIGGDYVQRVRGNRTDVVEGALDTRVAGPATQRFDGALNQEVAGGASVSFRGDCVQRSEGSMITTVGSSGETRSWITRAEGTAELSGSHGLDLNSETELVIGVGQSTIRLTPDSVQINSPTIALANDDSTVLIDGDGVTVHSSKPVTISGSRVFAKTDGTSLAMESEVQVDGSRILLNSPGQSSDPAQEEAEPPTQIELVDQDGRGVPLQRFVISLGEGVSVGGRTDEEGKAELLLSDNGQILFSDVVLMGEDPPSGELLPHVVRQGEYFWQLASRRGLDADRVWQDSANDQVREQRGAFNQLAPGDVVYLPSGERHRSDIRKGTSNRYVANVPTSEVSLVFRLGDEPMANESFVVEGLPEEFQGTTDGQGTVRFDAPVLVREVTLRFPERDLEYPLYIGDLDPIDTRSGVRQRLEHLELLDPHAEPQQSTAERDPVAEAIYQFQQSRGLEATGILDDDTRRALAEAHGEGS